jgi:hypothetical protein
MTRRPLILVSLILLAALALWIATRQSASQPPPKSDITQPVATVQPAAETLPQSEPPKAIESSALEPSKPYSPPAVHDPKLAALVDRNAKNRIFSDMSARFPAANTDDFPALLSVVSDSKDGDTERHEVVELLKRSHCPDLAQTLDKVLDNPAEGSRFRAFAMQHLGALVPDANSDPDGHQKVMDRLRSSLGDKDFQVRSQALQNLCRLKDPKGGETAAQWLTNYKPVSDKPDLERGDIIKQAIACVQSLGLKEHLSTIRQYARDPNEVIRIAAIVALSDWRDEASRPAFEEAAKSSSARLQRCGAAALKRLDAK